MLEAHNKAGNLGLKVLALRNGQWASVVRSYIPKMNLILPANPVPDGTSGQEMEKTFAANCHMHGRVDRSCPVQ